MRITAGYKHPQYLKEWGWPHYGVDCYDPNTHKVLAPAMLCPSPINQTLAGLIVLSDSPPALAYSALVLYFLRVVIE